MNNTEKGAGWAGCFRPGGGGGLLEREGSCFEAAGALGQPGPSEHTGPIPVLQALHLRSGPRAPTGTSRCSLLSAGAGAAKAVPAAGSQGDGKPCRASSTGVSTIPIGAHSRGGTPCEGARDLARAALLSVGSAHI